MKNIVDSCFDQDIDAADNVKLRLRGIGSGFKEGPNMRESSESLHLCVSGKYFSKFQYACALIEEHLENIYKEYKDHLIKYYHRDTQVLAMQKKVSVSNVKRSKKR